MDKIIRIILGLFIVILVIFVTSVEYVTYVNNAYRSSSASTYSYQCTITTDAVLSDVTFFIPVPATTSGTSPIIFRISSHEISGFPDNWSAVLFDTGKATLLQITAAQIGHSPVNGSPVTTNVTFSVDANSSSLIDTRSPIANGAIFRPVQSAVNITCPSGMTENSGMANCIQYTTAVYAKYGASPGSSVGIHASVTGKNSWTVFQPEFNEYQNTFDLTLSGSQNGWVITTGWLNYNIGSYDAPQISP